MAKTCLHPDCMHRRFGGGYCVSHQYLRTDKKDKPKRKRILAKSLKSLYEEIWLERSHVSYLTNKPIFTPTFTNFAHVVAKGKAEYKKYCREDKENIIILTDYEHYLLDFGKEAKRKEYADECKLVGIECNWEKIFRLKGILVNKYIKLKEKELQTI